MLGNEPALWETMRGFEVDLTTPLAFARASGARPHVGYGDPTVALNTGFALDTAASGTRGPARSRRPR